MWRLKTTLSGTIFLKISNSFQEHRLTAGKVSVDWRAS